MPAVDHAACGVVERGVERKYVGACGKLVERNEIAALAHLSRRIAAQHPKAPVAGVSLHK